jgi:hypothetical protein
MATAPSTTLFDEITDFLGSAPTLDEIISFKPSERLDQRLHHLLDKNSQEALSIDERAELDEFLRLSHLLNMVVLKARLHLSRGI